MKTTPKSLKLDTNTLLAIFGLQRNTASKNCDVLARISQPAAIGAQALSPTLEEIRANLEYEGDFWNEEELKMQFISLLFHEIKLNEPDKIKVFYERPLTAVVLDYKIQVICDCLLAKPYGIGDPATPYFFLQEFKKQKNAPDAEGQMLAAMLAAQHQNNNEKPILGCFIQGKLWTFATLHERQYCISRTLDASATDGLLQIVQTLHNIKAYILTDLM